ncbi:MAG: hypothetical protein AB8G22_24195 [Saprospiraceae bacterium]
MKNERLQSARLKKEELAVIKGGYKYVSGAAEAASFIGSAVDIRLGLGKEDINRSGGFSRNLEITLQ